ncbi:hypothetical protein JYT87_00370 [Nitrospira defluvii]|nr:hypothetical protein [Nitrospira defluvii]
MEITGSEPFGQDVFLQLLTTQLRFQDPLSPMSSTEFVTQLAQFTQLEQMTGMNATLSSLVDVNTSLNNFGMAGLIGKSVQVEGGAIPISKGTTPDLNFSLEEAAREVSIQITNSTGQMVRVLAVGAQEEGFKTLRWDGRDREGNLLPDGEYQFDLNAIGVNGESIATQTFSAGTVTGVAYENGSPYLIVNGSKVPASGVISVSN